MSKKSKIVVYVLAILIGSLLGYAYYYFIGCQKGSCPLQSNMYYNIFLGALLAIVLIETFFSIKNKKSNN